MAKTYEDLIGEARVLLKDEDVLAPRFPDADLIDILNRGLQAVARVRPDACYDLFTDNALSVPEVVESSPDADQTIWTDNIGIEMQFYNALVHYVVGMAEVTDDEYTQDGRAQLLLGQFIRGIVSI